MYEGIEERQEKNTEEGSIKKPSGKKVPPQTVHRDQEGSTESRQNYRVIGPSGAEI